MLFAVYGPGFTQPVLYPELVVEKGKVRKTDSSSPIQAVDSRHHESIDTATHQNDHASVADLAYRHDMSDMHAEPVLKAVHMMSSPVISMVSGVTVDEVFHAFEEHGFRHLPIVSPHGSLIGIISDKDLLQCTCKAGVSCQQRRNQPVETLMVDRVLAAGVDTDARHIARLFVERRIGALPIVDHGQVVGMVTRSDVLRAVMHSLSLNVWR